MAAAISSVSMLAAVSISSETGIVTPCKIFFPQDKRIIRTKPRPLAFKSPISFTITQKSGNREGQGILKKPVMSLVLLDFYEKNIQ
jgi:hypothetical protein